MSIKAPTSFLTFLWAMIQPSEYIDLYSTPVADFLRKFIGDNLKAMLKEEPAILKELVREILQEEKAHNPITDSKLLNRKEAAAKLGISLPTLHQYTKEGIIKGRKVGTRVRYSSADLLKAGKEIGFIKYRKRYDLIT